MTTLRVVAIVFGFFLFMLALGVSIDVGLIGG